MTGELVRKIIHPRKLTAGTQNLVVSRCFSFSKGVFSGPMLVFMGVMLRILISRRHVLGFV